MTEGNMLITFELPEDIAQGLETKWTDLPRVALESLALEAYRSSALSAAQLCRLLPPHKPASRRHGKVTSRRS
jgi:hypothetical protein